MQHELGMDTLGLADEYPTEDGLPLRLLTNSPYFIFGSNKL